MVRGNLHRLARAEFDRGPVEDSLPMENVTLMLRSTPAQQAALEELLREQQDPSSANYQQWLSPEEFADRFGLPTAEFNQIAEWLRSQGFTISDTARSRLWINFTGTARQLNATFRTRMHAYEVDGTLHYANSAEPVVPEALRNVVLGFHHLNNFRVKSRLHRNKVNPDFTSSISGFHFITPDDFATIYDLRPLYNAGIDGTGQTLAVAGQTDILVTDIRAFRTAAGLPANDPQVVLVPGTTDPGLQIDTGDLDEADLDLEWAGAVAKNAHIIYVNSGDVFQSFQYAINQNIASVLSISYGDCEQNWTAADTSGLVQQTQQANAQGMTVTAAAGDAGAADCEGFGSSYATTGLAVDIPGALPYVTSVGGTTLYDAGTVWASSSQAFGSFTGKPQPPVWGTSNNSASGSALTYIPELAWNDTNIAYSLTASGGGKSTQFAKPTWQTGNGVPNDNARDVPDISLAASPFINPYLTCTNSSCVNGFRGSDNSLNAVGGTSVGAPSFAGIVALINQKMNARQGNVNPALYRLAATTPSAFHDITSSGNVVPCQPGSQNCDSSGYMGYSAGRGYDLVTGLGTLDVFNLLVAWSH